MKICDNCGEDRSHIIKVDVYAGGWRLLRTENWCFNCIKNEKNVD